MALPSVRTALHAREPLAGGAPRTRRSAGNIRRHGRREEVVCWRGGGGGEQNVKRYLTVACMRSWPALFGDRPPRGESSYCRETNVLKFLVDFDLGFRKDGIIAAQPCAETISRAEQAVNAGSHHSRLRGAADWTW